MAHQAEQGHITAINDELAKFRNQKTTSPEKYNALITSIQSANIVHLDEDRRNLNSKQVSALTIPRLIFMDSKTDKDTLPDHIGMSILPDGTRTAAAEPNTEKSERAERAEEAAKVDQRMKETGNYGPRYGAGEGPANAAFEHVLNLKKQ